MVGVGSKANHRDIADGGWLPYNAWVTVPRDLPQHMDFRTFFPEGGSVELGGAPRWTIQVLPSEYSISYECFPASILITIVPVMPSRAPVPESGTTVMTSDPSPRFMIPVC